MFEKLNILKKMDVPLWQFSFANRALTHYYCKAFWAKSLVLTFALLTIMSRLKQFSYTRVVVCSTFIYCYEIFNRVGMHTFGHLRELALDVVEDLRFKSHT